LEIHVKFPGNQSNLDFNISAIDSNIIAAYGLPGGWSQHLTAGDIKYRAVPGTGYFPAFDFSFAERATHVSARVVDRMELTANIEKRDLSSIHLDHPGGAGRNVVGPRNSYKFWHCFLFA